eukprot:s590_g50.t1
MSVDQKGSNCSGFSSFLVCLLWQSHCSLNQANGILIPMLPRLWHVVATLSCGSPWNREWSADAEGYRAPFGQASKKRLA